MVSLVQERIVIIGGDAAGMSAASQIRRLRGEVEIIVLEKGPFTSYAACGIPYFVAGLIDNPDRLVARTPETFREKYGIDARTLQEVVAIRPEKGAVEIRDYRENRNYSLTYSQLLIATGAVPFRPSVPGIEAEGIFGINTLDSGIELHRTLERGDIRKAVVIGGGYIGLEIAEALHCHRGLEVSLVEKAPHVMGTLDPDMGDLVSEAVRNVGIDLYLEETLLGFEIRSGRVEAVVTDRRTLPADLVVLGLGVRPNTELARMAGIPLGVRNAIRVNERMQTPVEGIWAAGDCAETVNLVSRQPFYVALGTVANKMGRVAGLNLAGEDARFPGVLGTAVSKICRYEVARTGLLERDLKNDGVEFATAIISSRTRAGYYPGAGKIRVKLLARRGSGLLLGGQIIGEEGAAKRIDIVAASLHGERTVQNLIDMDLSYAPPFSPVWDPVQVAARKLLKEL